MNESGVRMMPRALILRSANSPFQILTVVACLISGVAGLFPHEPSGVIDQLTGGGALIWYSGLILGAAVTLGARFFDLPTSLLVERVGLYLLAGLALSYGVGIYLLIGFERARLSGVIIMAFGVACTVRSWQIGRDLQRLRRALSSPIELADDGPHLADPDDVQSTS
jgi:hypothetical protein